MTQHACVGEVSGDYDVFYPDDHVIVTEGDRQTAAVIIAAPTNDNSFGLRATPQFDVDAYWYKTEKSHEMWCHHADYFTRVKVKASSETPATAYESGDPILVGDVVSWTKRPGRAPEYLGREKTSGFKPQRDRPSAIDPKSPGRFEGGKEIWSSGVAAPKYTVHKLLKNGSVRINAGSDPCIADDWTRYVNVPPAELTQTGRAEC